MRSIFPFINLWKLIKTHYSVITQLITGKIGESLSKLEKQMKIRSLILLVSIGFFGTACSGAVEVATDIIPDTPSPTITELPPTQTPKAVEIDPPEGSLDEPISECTLVSSLPELPHEYAEISKITEDDWAVGPEDAAVTLIEYGDFQ